ncbi:hypothetical protein ACFL0M_01345 [Thermodesulfobacteriota bacterium]
MTPSKAKNFSKKHGAETKPDSSIRKEILNRIKDNNLPCAVAFDVSKSLTVSASQVGRTADLMNVKLVKCQLGLFGYKPENKIVKSKADVDSKTKAAIQAALVDDKLPCKSAWEIASRFNLSKMSISGACEAMNVKIKPCQLGAF